ncbi:hypothetical protein BGP_1484 [Beggiatoa sp. PS]|nr:hypothetical protein BGP_1484 [Beggiatoa sp. PS]
MARAAAPILPGCVIPTRIIWILSNIEKSHFFSQQIVFLKEMLFVSFAEKLTN